jgi:hypothetical protein
LELTLVDSAAGLDVPRYIGYWLQVQTFKYLTSL